MSIIFPLITVPYISRILLSDGLGKVNYASNIVAWFLMFASLGIPKYGTREIAKAKNNKQLLNKTFSELFYINLISSLTCSIAFIALIWITPYFQDKLLLYLVSGIQLFLNIFNIDWFYQGMEEYDYITKRSFVIKILSLLAMFIFVKTHDDYIKYALINSIALAGNYILNFYNLKNHIKFETKNLVFKPHLSPIFILLSASLAVSIYSLLDTTMIGIWCNDSAVGYYSNAQKLIRILSTLTASLGQVMFPRLTNMNSDNDKEGIETLSSKALDIILTVCIPLTIGIILTSSDVVRIAFGDDFLPCINTLIIFAPYVLVTAVGDLFGTQLLMVYKQEKKLLISVVVGSLINFTLNFILIRYTAQDGAALASVVTECIVMIVQIIMSKKYLNVKLNMKSFIQTCFMTIIMTIAVIGVQYFVSNIYLNLILSAVVGVVVFVALGFILKNDALLFLVNYLKKLVKHS